MTQFRTRLITTLVTGLVASALIVVVIRNGDTQRTEFMLTVLGIALAISAIICAASWVYPSMNRRWKGFTEESILGVVLCSIASTLIRRSPSTRRESTGTTVIERQPQSARTTPVNRDEVVPW